MKKKFTFDGYSFSLLKFNPWLAVYVASEGPKILFYQIFRVDGNKPIINRYGRYRDFSQVKHEFAAMTKKIENKVITNP